MVADPDFSERGVNPWVWTENLLFNKIFAKKKRSWNGGRNLYHNTECKYLNFSFQRYWKTCRYPLEHPRVFLGMPPPPPGLISFIFMPISGKKPCKIINDYANKNAWLLEFSREKEIGARGPVNIKTPVKPLPSHNFVCERYIRSIIYEILGIFIQYNTPPKYIYYQWRIYTVKYWPPPPRSVRFSSFSCGFQKKIGQTRMHSSRMRTRRSLTVPRGVSAFGPRGCLLLVLGGVCPGRTPPPEQNSWHTLPKTLHWPQLRYLQH